MVRFAIPDSATSSDDQDEDLFGSYHYSSADPEVEESEIKFSPDDGGGNLSRPFSQRSSDGTSAELFSERGQGYYGWRAQQRRQSSALPQEYRSSSGSSLRRRHPRRQQAKPEGLDPAAVAAHTRSLHRQRRMSVMHVTANVPPKKQVATLKQVFWFARTRRARMFIAGAFCCAFVTGSIMPAMAYFFAQAFSDLSVSPTAPEFLPNVVKGCYAFMILGTVMFFGLSFQTMLMESAAHEMTITMKSEWFRALLRQDMAYYDLKDVAGQATIIHMNGQRYKKGVGRKLAAAFQFIISFVSSVTFALYASWKVSLAALACVPGLYLSVKFLVAMNARQAARSHCTYEKAGAIVTTALTNLRVLLSLNAVPRMIEAYKEATSDSMDGAPLHFSLLGMANGGQFVAFLVAYMIVTLFGSWILYDNVRRTGCDPSGTTILYSETPNETCDPSAVNVFGALLGVTLAAADLPQVSVAIEAFIGARTACYPAVVAMYRSLGDDDDSEDNLYLDDTEPQSGADWATDTETDDVEIGESNGGSKPGAGGTKESKPVAGTAPNERYGSMRTELKITEAIQQELDILPSYQIDSCSSKGHIPSHGVTGDIRFNHVTFSYPARRETRILHDFTVHIPAGKTVAFVGPSGSGKSTLVQLIERFYDPLWGQITLDGVDLRAINVRWLRQQVGLVQQEPKLFGKSIRENIACGDESISQAQVEEAAKKANAHGFITSFPAGYDTQVGDLGGQLSGGQKQRIALARALCRTPKILLLDEATSALDSESEATVQAALDGLMAENNLTTIVIAHRLSTIRNADLIVVVQHGRIVEMGKHEELLGRDGAYKDLIDAQRVVAQRRLSRRASRRVSALNLGLIGATGKLTASMLEDINKNLQRANASTGKARSSIIQAVHRRVSYIDPSAFVTDNTRPTIIRFDNVHFRYPARKEVEILRGLNLSIYQGETIALVGPSGSGKSSCMALMERFYDPTQGKLEFNGVDVREINVRWLRDQFGLVSQEAALFHTTIEENIRYGCPDASMEDVVQAAKKANCHDFIVDFPEGYKTMIGEGSNSRISGGQKQRIAIARALIRKPAIYLLDEATSALDTESEELVQRALNEIMSQEGQTCVVIAHRLSTIQGADRIAFIDAGKVRELGTHEELMAKPKGRYRRLQTLQNLDDSGMAESLDAEPKQEKTMEKDEQSDDESEGEEGTLHEIDDMRQLTRRSWLMASVDKKYICLGAAGAIFAGVFFPAWGFVYAFMIELLVQRVELCPPYLGGFPTCSAYHNSIADYMQTLSFNIFYAYFGLAVAGLAGNACLFWGFGTASERMNKRIRDAAFTSLLRQEVGWFDLHRPGQITSQLSDDAALLHAFVGEPIRTLILHVASVLVGVIVSFVFMWPMAFVTLGILPFLGFGAEMEMRVIAGDEDGPEETAPGDESPGAIVVETLLNMRTVASLSLEMDRAAEYDKALRREIPRPLLSNFVKGGAAGLGQFMQYWGFALMFYWGGWLMANYSELFSYRSYLISMFSLFFSLYGLSIAAQGAVDRKKARAAAARIFALTDRESLIDPLDEGGLMDIEWREKLRQSSRMSMFLQSLSPSPPIENSSLRDNDPGSISTFLAGLDYSSSSIGEADTGDQSDDYACQLSPSVEALEPEFDRRVNDLGINPSTDSCLQDPQSGLFSIAEDESESLEAVDANEAPRD